MNEVNISQNGLILGEWRKAINSAQNLAGSIHEDSTAKKIGMRGGTVAGIVHLDLFAPILLDSFGKDWFETGSISMYYTFATVHNEEIRAVIRSPGKNKKDTQVEGWIETFDRRIVMKGSVSCGFPEQRPYLQTLEFKNTIPETLRILSGIEVGDKLGPKDTIITREDVNVRLAYLEDKIDWYTQGTPWGYPVVPLSRLWWLLHLYPERQWQSVPFFGATEFHMIDGPVKVGVQYYVIDKIICVGVSDKTEYFWVDGWLYEKSTDKLVATMRHLNRFMKMGSPLYSITNRPQ